MISISFNSWIHYVLAQYTYIFFKTLQSGVRFHYYPDEERKIIRIRKYLTGGKMPRGYEKLTFGDLKGSAASGGFSIILYISGINKN